MKIVLLCLFVALATADHEHGHGKHGEKKGYCFAKDAKKIKAEICDLVKDVTADAKSLVDSEMEVYEKTMKEKKIESENKGESEYSSEKEKKNRDHMNDGIKVAIILSSRRVARTLLGKCKACVPSKEGCRFGEKFEDRIDDALEIVMKKLDANMNEVLKCFLNDMEKISLGGDDDMDKEASKADDYLRKISEARKEAAIKVIRGIAQSACQSIKAEEKFHYRMAFRRSWIALGNGGSKDLKCAMKKIKDFENHLKETDDKMRKEFMKKE